MAHTHALAKACCFARIGIAAAAVAFTRLTIGAVPSPAIGLHITEADVAAAIADAAAGDAGGAVERVSRLIRDVAPNDESRKRELLLGLGIVHLRNGDITSCRSVLDRLAHLTEKNSLVAVQARAVLRVADTAIKDGSAKAKVLTTNEMWLKELSRTKQGVESELDRVDKLLVSHALNASLTEADQNIAKADDLIAIGRALIVDEEIDARLVQAHEDALKRAISDVNAALHQVVAKMYIIRDDYHALQLEQRPKGPARQQKQRQLAEMRSRFHDLHQLAEEYHGRARLLADRFKSFRTQFPALVPKDADVKPAIAAQDIPELEGGQRRRGR